MSRNADAVIIGGGIIGLATAFNLARMKYGKVVVVEKELFLGSGATAKCAGGIRAQFTTKVNIQMSMKSEEILVNFEAETGWPAIFDQCGYMFLLTEEEHVRDFEKSVALQRSLGLPVEYLSPDKINEIAPRVRTDDVIKATFCKNDGLADPNDLIQGYAAAARRHGVEIVVEAEAVGLIMEGGRVKGVKTKAGDFSSSLIINAAGPYAKVIAAMAGIDLPVEPVRRQISTTGALDFIKPGFPMIVDVRSGLYFHRESPGLLLGWADKTVAPGFDESVDPDYTDNIIMRALDRVPDLETAEISKSWAGLYETTPDHHAIIGWAGKVEGLFFNNGFSGHGMMHAPAAGLVAAEIITGKTPSVEITALNPERFDKGQVREETNVI